MNMVIARSYTPKQGHILVMDDDVNVLRIFSKALKSRNYQVSQANSIQQARQFIDSDKYDVFICDVHMGNERGTDLLLEKSDSLSNNQTQVVAISAYGQYRSLIEEVGVDFFLEKPVSIGTLLTLITRLLEQ
jgi:DNA-binding NtrC family response regulator